MKIACGEGLIINEEQLEINIDKIEKDIKDAYADSFALSISIAFPTTQNIKVLLQNSYQNAYNLAVNASVFTQKTILYFIKKAYYEMISLNKVISNLDYDKVSAEKKEKS